MLQSVEQMWKNFSDAVVPHDAGLVQRREMMKCFYAGARAMLSEVGEALAGEIPNMKAIKYVEGIEHELRAFNKRQLEGKIG